MRKTGFAAQTAWGNGFFDGIVCHVVPPYKFSSKFSSL
jgi:hypothetical protein